MTRGRGDAPLHLGKPSPELGEKLKTEFLPKGKVTDPQAAELYGLSSTAPRVDPQSSAGGAARAAGDADSGQVFRRSWTAGQREAVRRYFQEK